MDHSLRVLIVDDEPAHRLIARRAISRAEPAVQVLETGSIEETALLLPTLDIPLTVAFVDLNLGARSGLELLPLLAAPAVVISTSGLETDVLRSYQAGAACFLQKRSDPAEYAAVLAGALRFFARISRP